MCSRRMRRWTPYEDVRLPGENKGETPFDR